MPEKLHLPVDSFPLPAPPATSGDVLTKSLPVDDGIPKFNSESVSSDNFQNQLF